MARSVKRIRETQSPVGMNILLTQIWKALGSNQLPTEWILGAPICGVKQLKLETYAPSPLLRCACITKILRRLLHVSKPEMKTKAKLWHVGSHGDEEEYYCLRGCDAVWPGRKISTNRRYFLPVLLVCVWSDRKLSYFRRKLLNFSGYAEDGDSRYFRNFAAFISDYTVSLLRRR